LRIIILARDLERTSDIKRLEVGLCSITQDGGGSDDFFLLAEGRYVDDA
jgi:protein involved in sex pheromone biosynthesis